eukprot:g552.t1
MSWCTIESDPGVFNELVDSIGVKGVEFRELYGLDDDSLASLGDVYGLIFLFKWVKNKPGEKTHLGFEEAPHIFFASQTVNNACATQAILSILLNSAELELGPTLSNFKEFVGSLPPDMKGDAIGSSEEIRTAHNSFARPDPFVSEERKASADDEAFHFIAYLPVADRVYELDGLTPGPVDLGARGADGSWFAQARAEIQRRIAAYSASEIRFNLLAVTRSRKDMAASEAKGAESKVAELAAAVEAKGAGSDEGQAAAAQLAQAQGALQEAKAAIAEADAREAGYRKENARRRHDFVPFIITLLQHAAKHKDLPEIYKDRKKQRAEEAKERREKKKKEEDGKKTAAAAAAAAPAPAAGTSS